MRRAVLNWKEYKMELILSDEEYYDLFKALRFAIEQLPDIVGEHKGLLERLTAFYKNSPPAVCEFVITARETHAFYFAESVEQALELKGA
jgi:hypothetical protein